MAALVVVAAGPLGTAIAQPLPSKIEGPPNGSVTNNPTLSFSGFAAEAGGEGLLNQSLPVTFAVKTAASVVPTVVTEKPTVVTEKASSVTQTSATLNATVNPDGEEVTACKLEYGTSISYGQSASCTPEKPGSGTIPVGVSASVTSPPLTPNTTYHFRISATNAGGTSKGSDETFKTLGPPAVVTEPVSSLTQTSATLNATVNPDGEEVTACKLEYGTSISYGQSASCTPEKPGSGTIPVGVSASVTSPPLTPNTTYHFRISATNAGGTSKGSDETFKTLGPPAVVTEPVSSLTQTSATLNATVNPDGEEVTACKLEYGTSISYGQSASCTPEKPGSGTSAVAVTASVGSLTANTAYHFRISATNAGGTSVGPDETFKTLLPPPPTVTTLSSFTILASATVVAEVNANGGTLSDCHFDYGTSTSYGSRALCVTVPGAAVPAECWYSDG